MKKKHINQLQLNNFKKGFFDGLPIGLGYISVSFTFGIIAISYGLNCLEILIISMTNLTSAGQFCGIGIMAAGGSYLEMLIVQLTTNVRYAFMSVSLSQKADNNFNRLHKLILGFFTTDEIFAVSMLQNEVSKEYYFGLSVIPYIGWSLGSLLGALLGSILPYRLTSALGIAIYGMFIAIVVPALKSNINVLKVIICGISLMTIFRYLPILSNISDGFAMTICAIIAALIGAILYPVDLKSSNNNIT